MVMRLSVFLLGSFVVGPLVEAQTCPLSTENLRSCQGENLLAPKHHEASVVFLPPRARGYNELKQVLEGLVVDKSKTLVHLGTDDLKRLEEEARRSSDSKMLRLLAERTIQFQKGDNLSVDALDGNGDYVRDQVIYTVNPQNGGIQLRQVKGQDSSLNSGASQLCQIPVERIKVERPKQGGDSNAGGNIMTLPGGVCLSAEGVAKSFADSVCGPNSKKLVLEPDFSKLKHVDEIVNVVPRSGVAPPCDFAVVMASPNRFFEVLRQDPSGQFLPDEAREKIEKGERANKCSSGNCTVRISEVCELLDQAKRLSLIQNELLKQSPSRPEIRTPQRGGQSQVTKAKSRLPAGANGLDEKDWTDSLEEQERDKYPFLFRSDDQEPAKCSRFRNEDVIRYIEEAEKTFAPLRSWLEAEKKEWLNEKSKEFKQPKELNDSPYAAKTVEYHSKLGQLSQQLTKLFQVRKLNDELQARQDRNWEKIKKALPAECQKDKLRVNLPELTLGSTALNPNPTNLQMVGKTALYPEQFNSQMARDIEKSLAGLGLRPLAINSFKAHSGGGNVHCQSNEIRLCRP